MHLVKLSLACHVWHMSDVRRGMTAGLTALETQLWMDAWRAWSSATNPKGKGPPPRPPNPLGRDILQTDRPLRSLPPSVSFPAWMFPINTAPGRRLEASRLWTQMGLHPYGLTESCHKLPCVISVLAAPSRPSPEISEKGCNGAIAFGRAEAGPGSAEAWPCMGEHRLLTGAWRVGERVQSSVSRRQDRQDPRLKVLFGI